MPDTQQKTDKLSDIIKSIIPHIPADKMAALLNHPHANDVIDAAGQAAAKAAGVDTIANPNNSTTSATPSEADIAAANGMTADETARLKAISDIAVAAQQKAQQASSDDPQSRGNAPTDSFVDSLKGIGKLVSDQLINGYNQATKGK